MRTSATFIASIMDILSTHHMSLSAEATAIVVRCHTRMAISLVDTATIVRCHTLMAISLVGTAIVVPRLTAEVEEASEDADVVTTHRSLVVELTTTFHPSLVLFLFL